MAALRRKKMKDLVATGLRMVLDEEMESRAAPSPLEIMRLTRSRPRLSKQEAEARMAAAAEERRDGWTRDA